MQCDPKGAQALVGPAVSIIGVIAANPTSAVIQAVVETAPTLAATLPTVLTTCGAIVAAISQPPVCGAEALAVSR